LPLKENLPLLDTDVFGMSSLAFEHCRVTPAVNLLPVCLRTTDAIALPWWPEK
jgi:hypothetical protein